jgi:hypothetical protein
MVFSFGTNELLKNFHFMFLTRFPLEPGGRAGNFYRAPKLNGGPEEQDHGARNRQSMEEP